MNAGIYSCSVLNSFSLVHLRVKKVILKLYIITSEHNHIFLLFFFHFYVKKIAQKLRIIYLLLETVMIFRVKFILSFYDVSIPSFAMNVDFDCFESVILFVVTFLLSSPSLKLVILKLLHSHFRIVMIFELDYFFLFFFFSFFPVLYDNTKAKVLFPLAP